VDQSVVLEVVPVNRWGARHRLCTVLKKFVGIDVCGVAYGADVYCPLCGCVVPPNDDRHYWIGGLAPQDYTGPKCGHGFPDLSAIELAKANCEAWSHFVIAKDFPEYAAAELALRYGCAPTVLDWVRPCATCRQEAAPAILPLVRHGLSLIAERVTEDLRNALDRYEELRTDVMRLNSAIKVIEDLARQLSREPEAERMVFVYLISRGDAVKIGWTGKHPHEGRFAELQCASPEKLHLVGLMLGTRSDERYLHRAFGEYRIRGEWFSSVEEIISYFEENGMTV
jgi:hypothetical protein